MPKPTIDEILAPKPEARPRIYAYSIDDKAHAGLLKVGQSTRDVRQRVAEQLKTANIKNYTIVLDESAERDDGTTFTDSCLRDDFIGCCATIDFTGSSTRVETALIELGKVTENFHKKDAEG